MLTKSSPSRGKHKQYSREWRFGSAFWISVSKRWFCPRKISMNAALVTRPSKGAGEWGGWGSNHYPLWMWILCFVACSCIIVVRWRAAPLSTCTCIPYVPKKITIGLSAWITFKVVSESKYNFKLWKYDYFSTFQWRPHLIWSSNHIEIWIFVKQVTGPFVPSFAIGMYVAFTDTLPSQHTDLQTFQILCIPFQQRLILTT